jgi:hypothetical protein
VANENRAGLRTNGSRVSGRIRSEQDQVSGTEGRGSMTRCDGQRAEDRGSRANDQRTENPETENPRELSADG